MIKIEWTKQGNPKNKHSVELDNEDYVWTIEKELFYFLKDSINYDTFKRLSELILKEIVDKAEEGDNKFKEIVENFKKQIVLKEL